MNHYQRKECWCFVCGATDHFAQDCLHRDSFHLWWKEQLNSQGRGSQPKEPVKPSTDKSAHVAMMCDAPSMIASGPMAHWVGPETLVGLWVEGWEVNAVADSCSQVNTMMSNYMCRYEFPMLPLRDLVNHPLNLVGLGGTRTHLLGFVILRVQVKEITGYDKDVVFLVVPDESEFAQGVPIVVGACTLGRIVNVIKEGEVDRLLMPWAVVRASSLLSQRDTVAEDQGAAGDGPVEHGAMASQLPAGQDVDEPVYIKENVKLGPFQTQIVECRVKPLIGESTQVMLMPLRAGAAQPGRAWLLPLGLHVLHAYTRLKMSSSKVSVIIRNMSESPVFLKKGVQVAWVVSASLLPPVELSLEMEAALGMEDRCPSLLVAEQQGKLLEKLNLDGLSNWTPRNAAVVRELVLTFHDVFALDANELGCTSAVEHEIWITNSEPFKEQFRHIPPPLLEEVCTSLRDMLDVGAIHPSQSLGAMPWY